MKSITHLHFHHSSHEEAVIKNNGCTFSLRFTPKNKRKILKALLLEQLHTLFCSLFLKIIQYNQSYSSMECYVMDNQIIRHLIHEIVETGEYTLEGIAHYTRIPFDVIFDAACGNNNQFSITPWIKIVSLYIQVKPDVVRLLFDKLIDMKEASHPDLLSLLNES